MRKINTNSFSVATRSTSRDINRQIALNLINEHRMISRAELARLMNKPRGVVTTLIKELIDENLIVEGARAGAARGRRPTLLSVRTVDRMVIAVDVRYSRSYIMLSDFSGQQIAIESFEIPSSPKLLVEKLADRINKILYYYDLTDSCEGMGVVIPGIVENQSGRVVFAPSLGWENVDLRDSLTAATGLPVYLENAAKACALGQLWRSKNAAGLIDNFVHISVSDGIGVGIVVNGELLRGSSSLAGEFGHIPFNLEGPLCTCGRKGCWEAYSSNIFTVARYLGKDVFKAEKKNGGSLEGRQLTINDLVELALAGDAKAIESIITSAYYIGIGIANVVHAVNPTCVYLGGEITLAWSLIEKTVRDALKERTITVEATRIPIVIVPVTDYPRLRGAISLVSAPIFAVPRVA